jgi:CheY-like chemotaxis protein
MSEGKILIVDDDAAVRLVTAAMLERLNYTVVAVDSGAAALELCAQESDAQESDAKRGFDGVLLDLAMPDMSGVELLALLRVQYPRLAVVVMTGHADMGSALQIKTDTETRLLAKPFTIAELQTALATTRKIA